MYQPRRPAPLPKVGQTGGVNQQGRHGGRGLRGRGMFASPAAASNPFGETVNVNPATGATTGNVQRTATRRPAAGGAMPATNPVAPPAAPGVTPTPPWVHAPTVRSEIPAPSVRSFSGPLSVGYRGARIDVPGVVGYDGPMAASYMSRRVNPHGMVGAQADVTGIRAGQRGMFHVEPNERLRSAGLPTLDRFASDANRLERTTFERGMNLVEPQMAEQRQAVEQRLSDQGIPVGSEAYEAEMNRLDRQQALQRENMALSAVSAGRQEHSRITDLARVLQGQRFSQDSQGNQIDYGQRMGSARLAADESARRFRELSQSQAQQHRLNQINREFTASERGRDFRERLASEGQYDASRMARDRFGAEQARYAHGSDVQQRQQAYLNALAGEDQYFRQGLAADQYAAQQTGARDRFERGQEEWNAGFNSQEAARRYSNALAGSQFQAGQHMNRAGFEAGQNQGLFNNELARAGFLSGENQRGINNWLANQGLLNQRLGIDRGHDASVRGSRWSGIAGIAGAALPWILSDERAKTDHGVIDMVPIHRFTYHDDDQVYEGPMAQDVERIMPHAVMEGSDGMKRINLADVLASGV